MNDREIRVATVIADVTDTWLAVYDRLTVAKKVQDEAARVRAANGILVAIERSVGFRPPENVGYQTADKLPQKTIASPNTDSADTMPPAFDPANKTWRYCPDCHTTDINKVGKTSGKAYQACFKCHQLLQRTGDKMAMQDKREGGQA